MAETAKRPADLGTGAARAALGQGLMMGWGDEAEAWLREKMGEGSYEDNLRKIRGEYSQYSQENPWISGAAEFAGAAAPAVGAMFIPGGQAAGAMTGAKALAKLAAIGATEGAISGAGSAEEGNRVGGATAGTIVGGLTGVAAPVAVKPASASLQWLMSRLAPTQNRAERKAISMLSDSLNKSGMTPQQMEARVAADRAMGVPSTVANVSPRTAKLARGVSKRAGEGSNEIEDLAARQLTGTRERVVAKTQEALSPRNFYDEEERLTNQLRQKASTMYDKAYSVGEVQDPAIMQMLQLPEFKEAYKTARKIADSEASLAVARGEDPSQFALRDVYFPKEVQPGIFELELRQYPDVRTLDYMKRALDSMVQAGYKSDKADVIASTGVMKDLRNVLRDRVKTVVPEYDQALRTYAGESEVIDALRSGMQDFGKMSHEQISKMIANMSQGEKEAFRTGVARNLYSTIMTPSSNINAAQRIVGSPEMQAKLLPLFENPAQFDLFQAALQRESQLHAHASRILGGSDTAENLAIRQQLDESGETFGDFVKRSVTGGFKSSLANMAIDMMSKTQMNEKAAKRLSEMLMSSDPAEVGAVVRLLETYTQGQPTREAIGAGAKAAVTGGVAGSWMPPPAPTEAAETIDTGIESTGVTGPSIDEDIETEQKKPQ